MKKKLTRPKLPTLQSGQLPQGPKPSGAPKAPGQLPGNWFRVIQLTD